MVTDPTKRLSNIEALRIVALVLIVGVHVSSMGVINASGGSGNWLLATLVNTYSRFGVDIFVLIGAYFMCTKDLGLRSIAKRWWAILVPLAVLSAILFLFSPPVSVDEVVLYVKAILTGTGNVGWHEVWLGQIWFIFPFLLLIAISPLLNHAIRSMGRGEHRTAVLILAGIFIVIPTVNALMGTGFLFATNDTNTNLAYFVTLYFVAAYVRKYDVRIAPLKGVAISLLLGFCAFALICVYTLYLHYPSSYPSGAYDYFQGNNTLFIFAGAVFLFLAFRSVSFHSGVVSFTGKLTFEAFLFHSIALYLLMVYWPLAFSASVPTIDYALAMFLHIMLAVLAGLGYGLLRWGMDAGLRKVAEWSGIESLGSLVADRMGEFGEMFSSAKRT